MQILGDFQTSLRRALEEIDPNYENYPALIVCGTHSPDELRITAWLLAIQAARENNMPFLGICFGHQLAAIEYARNVLDLPFATSEEFGMNSEGNLSVRIGNIKDAYIVVKRPQGLKVGLHDGETYWNNYEVVEGFETMWKKANNFITCQFHPEYQSSKDKPHPLLVKFLNHAKMAM